MKYIVAVSGGVDSVVLLDMLAHKTEHIIIVAHFDHGIRSDSASDERFVALLAKKYGFSYESKREELGPGASEATARDRRYRFLRNTARVHNGKIVTAHHKDDVIETVAINVTRGTGWRGLAVFGDSTIHRPLTGFTKQELYTYALRHNLEWVEDETNNQNGYLRNRIRKRLASLSDESKQRLIELWTDQTKLAAEITDESTKHTTTSRHFFTMVDEAAALEVLRRLLANNAGSLTRPQLTQLLIRIKTASPGSKFEAGSGITIRFTQRDFIVKHPL